MSETSLAERPQSFVAHDAPVKIVRFSPDGKLMATGDTQIQVRIWRDGELRVEIDPRSRLEKVRSIERIRGMEFSPDGKQIYISASDSLHAYDTEDGKLLWEHSPPRFLGFLIVSPQAVAVSSAGVVAASFDYGSFATFTPDGQRLLLKHDNYAPRLMGFSPHGKALVGADGFNLCVWDSETGERVHRWRLEQRVFAMAVSKSEPLVATRELHTLTIWDIDRFEKICELPAGRGLPLLAFSPTQRVLATGERNRIRLMNLECKKVRDFDAEDATVLSVSFTPDGKQIVAGCSDHRVRFWAIE